MSGSSSELSRTSLLWQLLSVLLSVAPHLMHLPIWIVALVLGCLGWRFLVWQGRLNYPHWMVRALLVLFALAGIFLGYRAGTGISTTVALLIAAYSLKAVELHKRRDALVMLYVAVLVSASSFLFDQSVWMALYVLLVLGVIFTAIMTLYQTVSQPFWRPLKRCVMLLLPALPLMLVLFLVMPRLGALWEVRLDQNSARTGLSDSMSPGDITRLLRSPEVAFRARFSDRSPAQNALYWRALVFPDFDGRRWFNADLRPQLQDRPRLLSTTEPQFSYELILEANRQIYVPVLETVVGYPAELRLLTDETLIATQKQMLRRQYQLRSQLVSGNQDNTLSNSKRYLRLPEGNPQTRQLIKRWQDVDDSPAGLIQRIMDFYRESFYYSLTPPALGQQSVDDFLFNTRRGFCGHFASATAFMLRLAGVPARVVTGYQGGEYNPYENYFSVRQYDAHAWVEAWLPQQGWIRLDPTAAIAPDRVERSADQVFAGQPGFLTGRPIAALGRGQGLLASIRLRWEAFNYGWQRWVLNYHYQQQGLLQNLLGGISILRLALFMLLPFVLVIAGVMLWQLWQFRGRQAHPCDYQLHRLSLQLGRQGLQRVPGETVRHYLQRVAGVRTDLQPELDQLALLYETVRYAGRDSRRLQQRFCQLISACRRRA